jgi:hypothetical protein
MTSGMATLIMVPVRRVAKEPSMEAKVTHQR